LKQLTIHPFCVPLGCLMWSPRWFAPLRSYSPRFLLRQPNMASSLDRQKLLTWTADEVGKLLRNNALSVIDVVMATTQRINDDNRDGLKLAAIISLAPKAKLLELAQQLDKELAEGKPRGLLHGIPVVIKVCVAQFAAKYLVGLLIDDLGAGLLRHSPRSWNDYQRRKLCIIAG